MKHSSKTIRIKALIFILTCLFPATNLLGKEEYSKTGQYGTTNSTINISGVWNDSAITAVSNNLISILNYEDAEFEFKLQVSSLKTGIDSLDQKLRRSKQVISYKGKLGINYINTQEHPPEDFKVEGHLTHDTSQVKILGKGHLEHLYGNVYACALNISLHLNLKEANLNIPLSGLAKNVHIEIIQTIYGRKNE